MARTTQTQAKVKYQVIENQLHRRQTLDSLWKTDQPLPQIITTALAGGEHNFHMLLVHKDLRLLAPGFACADAEPDGFHLRTALLKAVSNGHGIAALRTAQWLYEGGVTPKNFDFYYLPYQKRPQGKLVHGLRKRIFPGDITEIHGVKATTPRRTQTDLGLNYEILAPVIR